MRVRGNKNLSIIPQRLYGGLPDRTPNMMANPVSRQPALNYRAIPYSRAADVRSLHPKLNQAPWSATFAVKRSTPKSLQRQASKQRMM